MTLSKWLRMGALLLAGAMLPAPLVREAPAQPHPAAAEPYPAEEMLSDCRTLLATASAAADAGEIELDNTFPTGTCWGAFLSIQQLATIKIAGAKQPVFQVCVPEDTTLIQIIQLFDAYARRHPERLSEPFTIVALAALHEAFSCK